MSEIKSITARILVEKFPNDRMREFFTSIQLTKEKGVRLGLGGMYGIGLSDERHEKAGEAAQKLLQRVYDLHGVVEASVEAYEVCVTIGKAFDWDEVQPYVLDVLKTHIAGNGVDVEVKQQYAPNHFKYGTEPVDLDSDHPEPEQFEPEEDRI